MRLGDVRDCEGCGSHIPVRLGRPPRFCPSCRTARRQHSCDGCGEVITARHVCPVRREVLHHCTWVLTSWWSDDYRVRSASMTDEEFWRYARDRLRCLVLPLAA